MIQMELFGRLAALSPAYLSELIHKCVILPKRRRVRYEPWRQASKACASQRRSISMSHFLSTAGTYLEIRKARTRDTSLGQARGLHSGGV